jgi:hypothetical protein
MAAASSHSSAPKQGTMSHITIAHESTEVFYVLLYGNKKLCYL